MKSASLPQTPLLQTTGQPRDVSLRNMANAIRLLAADAVEKAGSGHPGMPMGMADVATVLFHEYLNFDPLHPHWPNRDRFVLSAGHGSMLLYALLYLCGYPDMTMGEIRNFRQLGAKTAGHPEYGHATGIETTTGPLGQGIANAVGMALHGKLMQARLGQALMDHKIYALAGDGCLMEGIAQEAISLAGHLKLDNLVLLFDDNHISIDGPTSLTISDDTPARFRACGWETLAIDGHDIGAIRQALEAAKNARKPLLIACETVIGYGSLKRAGTKDAHGSPLGPEEIEAARTKLEWPHEAFHVPEDILQAWRGSAQRGQKAYLDWQKAYGEAALRDPEIFQSFERALEGRLPDGLQEAFALFMRGLEERKPKEASRKSSQETLEFLTPLMPELIGGSADLTGSNNTKTKALAPVSAQDFSGRYLYYGVREHAMGAVMNGLALGGGLVPYGGTFLAFSDYCRPAIRLSALMGLGVIYVMTHDSIGLGEDGPTHQPVEHLAALRAIPNLHVFRPADAAETAECWMLALSLRDRPSLLALSRQNLPWLREETSSVNRCARGGYVLREDENARVTLIATGSEVSIALEALALLKKRGIAARLVSMPCLDLFEEQDETWKRTIIGKKTLKIVVEAGIKQGWERYLGEDGVFVGMESFGASGPIEALYQHFGITAKRIAQVAEERIKP